ncbi:RNA polymerase sigma-70 factor [Rhodococcus sp. TAF43]|uniref:RNA polymerase sigma-70 factor n=1 Tax=Rhodococcus sp. TAF43 TaxID=3237483 RepID=UPI003F9ABB91
MLSTQVFTECRPLLFTIAYEILGSAADAEDVVQDSFLRWCATDPGTVERPRAYLVQIVTRQALNQMRGVQRRREDYVGSWLPEPICTAPDADEDTLLAESVSIAMLLVLETLNPHERAVFVLGEVFGYPHKEIAVMVGKSDAAVRQIAHRAREHVQTRRPRFQPDSQSSQTIVVQFLLAAKNGDVQQLMNLMAPGVVEITDGGGKVTAARKPVVGAERVARYIVGLARKSISGFGADLTTCNALPAVLFTDDGRIDSVLVFDIDDGLIRALYAVRNPDKLGHSRTFHPLTRMTGHNMDTTSAGESS